MIFEPSKKQKEIETEKKTGSFNFFPFKLINN